MTAQLTQELPEFPTWLNARPSTLQEHRGRALVLAFVNASSVWCAERLAELARWQARSPGRLQVIVVQVPRFDSERMPQRSLKQLRGHGVSAPILLDKDWETWRRFGIESWPTLVLLDAYGRERQRLVGVTGDLDKALAALCEGQQPPSDADLHGVAERDPEPRLALRFPTGLAATEDRLYIADTGHHRILECTHSGRVLRQFGHGNADLIDGGVGEAAFRRPQGLALEREELYVADTGNHALRRINLRSGQVDTLCGTGRSGEPVEGPLASAGASPLNYPQGLAVADNQLLIAMAGDNRIWSYHLGRAAQVRAPAPAPLKSVTAVAISLLSHSRQAWPRSSRWLTSAMGWGRRSAPCNCVATWCRPWLVGRAPGSSVKTMAHVAPHACSFRRQSRWPPIRRCCGWPTPAMAACVACAWAAAS